MSGVVARRGLLVHPAVAADRPEWDAFVAAHPEGDPLGLWAWGEVRAPFGERPVRLLVRDRDGALRGVAGLLVRAAFAGRTVGYVPHGPLWDRDATDADDVLVSLLDGLRAVARRERTIVVKVDPRATGPEDGARIAALLSSTGLRRARHDLQAPRTAIVDLLDGGDALWKTWDPAARNQARRAAREGVTVSIHRTADPAPVVAFHAILASTSARAGFRIPSAAQLVGMAAALAPTGSWCLALASAEGVPISGAVLPTVGDRAFYLYGASRRDEAYRRMYGSNAVMAEGMRALASDGVRTLDLWGVADPSDPDADPAWAGFSDFKRQFGGTSVRHPGTFDLVVSPAWDAVRAGRERLRDRLAERRSRRG